MMNTLDKQISSIEMFVTKRNGKLEAISFDKILRRIKTLCNVKGEPPLRINPTSLCIKIFEQLRQIHSKIPLTYGMNKILKTGSAKSI